MLDSFPWGKNVIPLALCVNISIHWSYTCAFGTYFYKLRRMCPGRSTHLFSEYRNVRINLPEIVRVSVSFSSWFVLGIVMASDTRMNVGPIVRDQTPQVDRACCILFRTHPQ